MHVYQENLCDFGEEVLTYKEPIEGHRSPKANTYPLTLITSHHVHSVHSQHLNLS